MTTATAQPTGFRHPYMTPKQAKWMFDLINSRIPSSELEAWKQIYFDISGRNSFESAINSLKAKPVLAGKIQAIATEDGLYRNPADGTLYRLSAGEWGRKIVSIYSKKATLRRLLVTGEEVKKGSWKRLNQWDSRKYTQASLFPNHTKILAEWQMTDQDKIDYVTGICNFCYRGLIDARSVKHNYGPKCAKDHDLPWGE